MPHPVLLASSLRRRVRLLALGAWLAGAAAAQPIYRCGNEFTNVVVDPERRGCRLIQGTQPVARAPSAPVEPASPARSAGAASGPRASGPVAGARVDPAQQRARDADARQILEAELRKAQARHAELLREYNRGEPERRADETRNPQRYQDRVAEMKASIERLEADMAGIRRELARQPQAGAAPLR
ncbi:MAG: hypothetical protein FGM55_09015 [Rhodoferax sp.]|nr:hypothetical protein [Rhodoferax sp.]